VNILSSRVSINILVTGAVVPQIISFLLFGIRFTIGSNAPSPLPSMKLTLLRSSRISKESPSIERVTDSLKAVALSAPSPALQDLYNRVNAAFFPSNFHNPLNLSTQSLCIEFNGNTRAMPLRNAGTERSSEPCVYENRTGVRICDAAPIR
jgi:hypothetical protein